MCQQQLATMRGLAEIETFEIFIYICRGRQLSNSLIPHLPLPVPFNESVIRNRHAKTNYLHLNIITIWA
jgi:hypothetical protein